VCEEVGREMGDGWGRGCLFRGSPGRNLKCDTMEKKGGLHCGFKFRKEKKKMV